MSSASRPFLLLIFLISFLSACKKNSNDGQPLSIVGTWTLQEQHAVMYVNGALKVDTIFTSSSVDSGSLQFNGDGSFSSSTIYVNTLQNHDPGSSGNVQGTYSVSGYGFNISPGIAGWFNYVPTTSPAPTLSSSLSEVTSLTASSLKVHLEDTFSYITNNNSTTVRTISDFTFIK